MGKKKNNPFGGRKGKKKNNPYGGKKGKLKVNPANYQTKAQKQNFISQITADGRVNQQEATNAATLGISSNRIQKGYDKSYYPGNPFTPEPKIIGGRGPTQIGGKVQERPYLPLIIGNKSRDILGSGSAPINTDNNVQDDANDGTTGPVDPIGPIDTDVDDDDFSFEDLINAIVNMPQPVINLPPPPVYEPPPSFASIGEAASATPGVRIRRSRSRAQGTNTLGTNFFNRGTRNTLKISGLNV